MLLSGPVRIKGPRDDRGSRACRLISRGMYQNAFIVRTRSDGNAVYIPVLLSFSGGSRRADGEYTLRAELIQGQLSLRLARLHTTTTRGEGGGGGIVGDSNMVEIENASQPDHPRYNSAGGERKTG